MIGKIELVGQEKVFTTSDAFSADLILKRSRLDISLEELINCVEMRLVCEGCFSVDSDSSKVRYFESEPLLAHCVHKCAARVAFRAGLRFPDPGSDLPSTVVYNEDSDSIKWFVCATVYRNNGLTPLISKRQVTFVQSDDLPPILNLVDNEHIEKINDTQLDLLITHSAAGLPQVPLAAGISILLKAQPHVFSISRLRVFLGENTTIEMKGLVKAHPTRRWLLTDHQFTKRLMLDQPKFYLDKYTSDLRVGFSNIPPSFRTENMIHSFTLNVELTVMWADRYSKRFTSVSPVTVLPRVLGAVFVPLTNSKDCLTIHYDTAEITDSSEDESIVSFSDDTQEVGVKDKTQSIDTTVPVISFYI